MSLTTELIQIFESIPASFWGVVFGSLLSLGGVTLSNRASDKRLRAQFDHERMQHSKEREMALRKEVYLVAADAMSAGINTISRFANLELPNDQVTSDYIKKSPAIAKVHVIAKAETIQAMVNFTGELGTLHLKLFARRSELMKDRAAITLIDSQVTDFGKERDRILELIKQQNIEGIIDNRRWNVLHGNFDFEQKRINEALAQRAQLIESLHPKILEFMRDCVHDSTILGKLLIPTLLAVRSELELPLNDKAYKELVSESIKKQQQAIDDFIIKFMPATKPITLTD
jgi:hypothetical protein